MTQQTAKEVERVEVRPGLTMVKRRTLKDDGRYLLYYEFERAPETAANPEE